MGHLTEDVNYYKREVSTLKSEKELLETGLSSKAKDVRETLGSEIMR